MSSCIPIYAIKVLIILYRIYFWLTEMYDTSNVNIMTKNLYSLTLAEELFGQ